MDKTTCLVCGLQLQIEDNLLAGDLVTCPKCWTIYEIDRLSPLKINWPEDPQVYSPMGRKRFVR